MRKSKIKFTSINEEVLDEILIDPESLFGNLEEFSIKVPTWSKLLLVIISFQKGILEANFFEDTQDFFVSYTKKMIRYTDSDLEFICYSREQSDDWRLFSPPTLIGTNLITKLRN